MENQSEKSTIHKLFHIILYVFGLALIGAFIFYYDYGQNLGLKILGTAMWLFSVFFAWLPIYIFKRKGGVPAGEGYVSTTKLVTTGIYSVVRHPQYLAGILFSLSFMLVSQHWLVIILGIPLVIIFYIAAWDEDKSLINKFGDEYRQYMKSVPRMNFLSGLVRKIGRK